VSCRRRSARFRRRLAGQMARRATDDRPEDPQPHLHPPQTPPRRPRPILIRGPHRAARDWEPTDEGM
ncbi:MAG: hypothetical protein AVDCRST_MAG18-2818, partial [uncultured Thermomicrobiales bacterium]